MKPVFRVPSLPLLGSMLLSAAGCDQPRPKCSVAPGFFAATYRLLSSSGDCGEPLRGETLGVQVYYMPISPSDQSPNYRRAAMAIQPKQLTDLLAASEGRAEPHPDDHPYAMGEFTTGEPGYDDTCRVPMPTIARVRLPLVPTEEDMCGPLPELPAADVSYTFNDVRVLVTAATAGTWLEANLTYQTPTCWATYRVSAVYPAVPCGVSEPMDGGVDAEVPDAGSVPDGCTPPSGPQPEEEPDASLCGAGSGIAPEFAVTCDPVLLLCVPAEPASTSQ